MHMEMYRECESLRKLFLECEKKLVNGVIKKIEIILKYQLAKGAT